MNLRSGKVVIKRPKHSSSKSHEIEEEDDDIISKLPDALLIQILSLLPEADANRTRILSNRWKNLWAFLPYLHFVMPFIRSNVKITKFHNAVIQTLALRGGMPIERFSLYYSRNFSYDRVRDLIRTVVQCNVKKLELRVPPNKFKVKFCWDLLKTCNNFIELTLNGKFMLDVPELFLPCLKIINLESIVYVDDTQSFSNLISGCPSLEEFSVGINIIKPSHFNISSTSLKRLRIFVGYRSYSSMPNKVMIDAPNVEYLYIEDYLYTEFILKQPFCPVEAHFSSVTYCVPELIACLSSAKKLTITRMTIALRSVQWIDMPLLSKLVELVVGIPCLSYLNLLLRGLLNNMPNLEHITFSDLRGVDNGMGWHLPVVAPACLRFKVKKMVIKYRETVRRSDFHCIRYLLEHSTNLEKLIISAHNIDPKTREQLLNIHCGSNSCEIEFV